MLFEIRFGRSSTNTRPKRLVRDQHLCSHGRQVIQYFLSLRLSPLGDRWREALAVLSASSVSSSSTLQIFQDASPACSLEGQVFARLLWLTDWHRKSARNVNSFATEIAKLKSQHLSKTIVSPLRATHS